MACIFILQSVQHAKESLPYQATVITPSLSSSWISCISWRVRRLTHYQREEVHCAVTYHADDLGFRQPGFNLRLLQKSPLHDYTTRVYDASTYHYGGAGDVQTGWRGGFLLRQLAV